MTTRLLLLVLGLLVAAQLGLYKQPGDSSERCGSINPGETCYWKFTDTTDSSLFEIKAATVSWEVDGDGTADILMYAYRVDESGGAVITCDLDNDGDVDAVDEAITFDGSAGRRGCRGVPVSKPKMKVDVQTAPGSGTAYVTIRGGN